MRTFRFVHTTATVASLLLAGLAVIIIVTSPVSASGRSQDLAPADDVFSWLHEPVPYELAVRDGLLGQQRYRRCQIVAIPSRAAEWAVYLIREADAPSQLVARSFRKHLYAEMMALVSGNNTKQSYSVGPQAQATALKRLRGEVETSQATVSAQTADILEAVWSRMLRRVRYADVPHHGEDGVSYHVFHWSSAHGGRSGITWSPPEGSRARALVKLAERMRAFAEAPSVQSEVGLQDYGGAILMRLKTDD